METVYPAHAAAKPTTVVVHCGDPRFQVAFQQFIAKELKLKEGEFIPLVVMGGVAHLSEPLKLPKDFRSVMDQLSFYLDHFGSLNTLVFINHEECGRYAALATKLGQLFHIGRGTSTVAERIEADLQHVNNLVQDKLPRRVKINLYYAYFADAERKGIIFDKVA